MSFRRRSSVRAQDRESGRERGPNGRRLCRFCRKEVDPPRVTFCSDACVHHWKLRSSTKYLRAHVYERDLGGCASCGRDSRVWKIAVEDAGLEARRRSGQTWRKDAVYAVFLKAEGLTVKEAEKTLWQADHIIPVALNGGECGLDGIQTLCLKCHKSKTAAQAKDRRIASLSR
jgi:hypothetical protein